MSSTRKATDGFSVKEKKLFDDMLVSFSSFSVYSNSVISDYTTRSLISWHLKTLKTLLNVIQTILVILTFHLM